MNSSKQSAIQNEQVARYTDMFRALGIEAGVRILRLLAAHPEGLVVGDIQAELSIPASTLSQHLDKLKTEELVSVQRDGTHLWCRANVEPCKIFLASVSRNAARGIEPFDRKPLRGCVRRATEEYLANRKRTTKMKITGAVLALGFLALSTFAQDATDKAKTRVLILCTGNSARSQMSAGFLKSFDSNLDVYSAGTNPAPKINPYAVRAMQEAGIDISAGTPKSVSQFLDQRFDYVITVCDDADKNCPNFRGKVGKRVHIGFPDPAKAKGTDEQIMAVFRETRDNIKTRFFDYYQTEIRKGN